MRMVKVFKLFNRQDDEDDNIKDGKGLGAIQSSAKPLGHGGCKVLLPLSRTFPSSW